MALRREKVQKDVANMDMRGLRFELDGIPWRIHVIEAKRTRAQRKDNNQV